MAEFVIKLADDVTCALEQVQTAATGRAAGSVCPRRLPRLPIQRRTGFAGEKRRKVKLEPFLISTNRQFLTLIRGRPADLAALQMLPRTRRTHALLAQLDTSQPG